MQVETAAIATDSRSGSGYLLAVASGTAVAVLCLAAIGAFMWRNGASISTCRLLGGPGGSAGAAAGVGTGGMHSTRQSRADLTRHDEEKSNNLQNEENFRRLANPLKCSAQSLRGDVELTPAPEVALVLPLMAGPSALHRSQPLFPVPVGLGPGLGVGNGNGGGVIGNGGGGGVVGGGGGGGGGGGVGSVSVGGADVEFADKDPDSVKTHRGSQILFKAQNPDMHKNTIGSMESSLKDFGKRSINCQTLPGSVMTTTMVTMDPDVLSVHV